MLCHRYALFYESKVFFLSYATTSRFLQRFNLLLLVVLHRAVNSCLKIVMELKMHVISHEVLMIKSKDRICYMHLKLHINPPYAVNFILIHTFFFPWLPTWNKKKFAIRNFGQKYKLKVFYILSREKGRYLTQSYDKSPYTNRNVKRAKCQHKQRHKKFDYRAVANRH